MNVDVWRSSFLNTIMTYWDGFWFSSHRWGLTYKVCYVKTDEGTVICLKLRNSSARLFSHRINLYILPFRLFFSNAILVIWFRIIPCTTHLPRQTYTQLQWDPYKYRSLTNLQRKGKWAYLNSNSERFVAKLEDKK